MSSNRFIPSNAVRTDIASNYIRAEFQATDRLAVVVLNKESGAVIQRIATAEKIAAPDFQAWLRHQNAERNEIYISMNPLREGACGRTKADVRIIRHIYLDLDENGTAALQRLRERPDLPQPNHLINSSPDKWQVVWKVEGFSKEQAEALQRALARQTGADPAATDCSRVLRLPGFNNHKYARRHLVSVESLSAETYGPERFPAVDERWQPASDGQGRRQKARAGKLSQSERDWAYAKRALARGDSADLVVAAIASYRRYDKHNPQYYAEHTVKKAADSLTERVSAEGPERT